MAFEIYLDFTNGEANEAFETYEKLFNGKRHPHIMRFKDVPGNYLEHEKEYFLHAEMMIENMNINFSDVPKHMTYTKGNQVSIMYTCQSVEDVLTKFNVLSQDGEVFTKPGKTFFAESYCHFVDKFGIPWQFIFLGK